ncbi:hypothetical protein ACKLNO_00585 [Neisseriaceae bacterium B1]
MPAQIAFFYPAPQKSLDGIARAWQNLHVAFNQVTGFSSPNTTRQIAAKRTRVSLQTSVPAAFLYLHSPSIAFSWETGVGGFMPARNLLSSLLTRLLFPAYTFSSVKAGLSNPTRKGKSSMISLTQNAPIDGAQSKPKPENTRRKSGFHTWQPENHAPSIQTIVMQIKRDYGADYQAKRAHIHAQFSREYAAYRSKYDAPAAREMAAYNAQYRVDSLLNVYRDNAALEQRIKAAIKARFNAREAKRQAAKCAKAKGASHAVA